MKPKRSAAGSDPKAPATTRRAPTERRRLIPIEPGNGPVLRSNGKSDPYTFWMSYYNTKDLKYISLKERSKAIGVRTDPEALRDTVRLLNASGKTRDVHAALLGYLTNHPDRAESWMYRALALAIELLQGSSVDVKTALNYAADRARQSHNPNDLVASADMLFLRGYLERVGPLLDEAMTKVPHRGEPILMSINLAAKTKDPRRMADSVERLLSLGWPGQDEYARTVAHDEAEGLVRSLRELGKKTEADTLRAALAESEARDLLVRLTWDGHADFDLTVQEPLGATASYQTPRTVFGGALLQNGFGIHPEETYVCPRAFDGDYQIGVSTIWTNPAKPVTRLKLEIITHEGTKDRRKQVVELAPDKPAKPLTIHLAGGRRKVVLPYFDPVAAVWEAVQRASRATRSAPSAKRATPSPAKPQ
jgi:hypothetical protein